MLKIIFLSDTHLGFDYPIRPRKEKRRRGIDFFNNFDKVLEYAKKVKADLVIHGGDLFFRTRIPPTIVDMVYERIFNFAESDIPIVIVPGNHESSRLPISLFMQHRNIYYFSKPEVFSFQINGLDLDVAGFPCVRKNVLSEFPGIVKDIASQLCPKSLKLLCMHQSVEGAKVGPSNYTFRGGPDVIPIHDIPSNYDMILSGHIHRSQMLYSKNNTPILYPGSIERTAFAEMDETKGFYEITISDSDEVSYQFIELYARPMFDVILEKPTYSPSALREGIHHKIKDLPMDSIVRIKMTSSSNLHLLTVKFLDDVFPKTMNYQVAGIVS